MPTLAVRMSACRNTVLPISSSLCVLKRCKLLLFIRVFFYFFIFFKPWPAYFHKEKNKIQVFYCCERSEQHPFSYRGQNLDFSELLMSLAFVLLNNTTCVTACVTTCVLSRSSHSVLLWRTFAVWVISLSIW